MSTRTVTPSLDDTPPSNYGYLGLDGRVGAPELLELVLRHLEQEHGYTRADLLRLAKETREDILIPVDVICGRLSALEAIVKYLVEEKGMKYSETARLLNRDLRTIWGTYQKARKKFSSRLRLDGNCRYLLPITSLASRRLSTLESIAAHLHERYGLGITEIAQLLGRKYSTIWTACRRAKMKQASRADAELEGY